MRPLSNNLSDVVQAPHSPTPRIPEISTVLKSANQDFTAHATASGLSVLNS